MNKKNFIPLSVPNIGDLEKKYLLECINSNWISTKGPLVKKFEDKFSNLIKTKFSIATNSGTAALHLALLSLDIGNDDIVLVPDLTFISPVNVIKYVGAQPILIDADKESWQIDSKLLKKFLESECLLKKSKLIHKRSKKKIKAILVVHILGYPSNIKMIKTLAKKFNLPIIEDVAEALGTKINGEYIGNDGVLSCYSFNGNKIITTGGGGMVTSQDYKLIKKINHISNQSKLCQIDNTHDDIGYNYKMTAIQVSLGIAQLKKLNKFLAIKRVIAKNYALGLQGLSYIKTIKFNQNTLPSHWLYSISLNLSKTKYSLKKIISIFKDNNIEVRRLWEPMHLSKAHKDCLFYGTGISKLLYECSISLPCSTNMNSKDQKRIIKILRELD